MVLELAADIIHAGVGAWQGGATGKSSEDVVLELTSWRCGCWGGDVRQYTTSTQGLDDGERPSTLVSMCVT